MILPPPRTPPPEARTASRLSTLRDRLGTSDGVPYAREVGAASADLRTTARVRR